MLASKPLQLRVMNDNLLGDTLIGSAVVPLGGPGLALGVGTVTEVELRDGKQKPAGRLRFTLTVSVKGDDTDVAARAGGAEAQVLEGPGTLLLTVKDLASAGASLHEPRVDFAISALGVAASTRRMLAQDDAGSANGRWLVLAVPCGVVIVSDPAVVFPPTGHFVWDQEVLLPCYCPPRKGPTSVALTLEAKVVDALGGILGREIDVGHAGLDVTDIVRSRAKEKLTFTLGGGGGGKAAGFLNLELQYLGSVDVTRGPGAPLEDGLRAPGRLQIFVLEAAGLRTVEERQVGDS
jgi:hypothetical protein